VEGSRDINVILILRPLEGDRDERVELITGFILLPSLQIGCVPKKAKIDNGKTLETFF